MDAKLRRELAAIARDNRSGAAELCMRVIISLEKWLRKAQDSEEGLTEVAAYLLHTQPDMAPTIRIANEILLAIDTPRPKKRLAKRLRHLRLQLNAAPSKIATRFAQTVRRMFPRYPLHAYTYSYSSTVVAALRKARSKFLAVECSEGRPLYEGRRMAKELASAGLEVGFHVDAKLFESITGNQQNILVLGADAITPFGFANKIGTGVLTRMATLYDIRTFILADTLKLLSKELAEAHRVKNHPPGSEVWSAAPRGVEIWNSYFVGSPYPPRGIVVTERGAFPVSKLNAVWKQIPISPRLRTLVD